MVKRIHKLTKKAPTPPRFTDMGQESSDDDNEEKELVVKTVSKSLGLVETGPEDSRDSGTENTLSAMGFPIDKSLELGKNEKEVIFRKGIYKGKKKKNMLQHLILTTLKNMHRQETKRDN